MQTQNSISKIGVPSGPPKSLEVGGAQLHYIERGQGDPVVFVHGGLSDLRSWRPQMEPFAERYHAISYSRRGHYPNAWGDYTRALMDQHVADLAGIIEKLTPGRAHLVGNSYGAYISLLLALRHPDMVRAMVLAEPPVHPLLLRIPGGDKLFEQFRATAWDPAGRAFRSGDLEQCVRLFIEGAVGKGAYDDLPLPVREAMMKNAPELGVATLTEFDVHMPDFTCQDASQIQAPTLLLRGELSPRMYYLINDELARCLPNAEQALIPQATHVLHGQNPEAHNQVALAFLAKH
ncbi:MAG: alpha/beta fold hydrolase [Chloroflexia bacterium]